MKRYRWWLSSLLAAVFAFTPALAAREGDPGDRPKRRKRDRRKGERRKRSKRQRKGLYEQVVSACKLTEQQQVKFKEALQGYYAAQKENKEKVGELRKAQVEARKAKDRDKMRELAKQRRELEAPVKEALAKALAVLSPEQRLAWEANTLFTSVTRRLRKVDLTDLQKADIRKRCEKTAKDLQGADEKSKRSGLRTLSKEVHEEILTDEQKAKVKAPKGRKRQPREKKRKKRGRKGREESL